MSNTRYLVNETDEWNTQKAWPWLRVETTNKSQHRAWEKCRRDEDRKETAERMIYTCCLLAMIHEIDYLCLATFAFFFSLLYHLFNFQSRHYVLVFTSRRSQPFIALYTYGIAIWFLFSTSTLGTASSRQILSYLQLPFLLLLLSPTRSCTSNFTFWRSANVHLLNAKFLRYPPWP